jgi:hypothetical protein
MSSDQLTDDLLITKIVRQNHPQNLFGSLELSAYAYYQWNPGDLGRSGADTG